MPTADTGPSCGLSYPSLEASGILKGSGRGRSLVQLGGLEGRASDVNNRGQNMGCLAPNQHELGRSQDMTRMPLPSPMMYFFSS